MKPTPSSISSSSPGSGVAATPALDTAVSAAAGHERSLRRALVILLGGLAAGALALEIVTAAGFGRVSRIQGRIEGEYREAKALRHNAGRPSLLVAGNSLLLAGIDFPGLRRRLAPDFDAHRLVIDNTQYLDWYFGLRRLFHEGSRPDRLVLVLTVSHLVSNRVRGEYFAHYQMLGRDVMSVQAATGIDNTTASNFLFSNWSSWLGSRSEIRKWFLGRVLPEAGLLARLFPQPAPPLPDDEKLHRILTARLRQLRKLCGGYGTEIAIALPPLPNEDGRPRRALLRAGAAAGIPVLTPAAPGEYPLSLFLDGFHLSERGAARLTPNFGDAVLELWKRR